MTEVLDPPPAPAPEDGEQPAQRTKADVVADVLLTVLAIFGAVCIVLVILAFVFGFTIILFKTGSMAPAIPQGSAAIAQTVSASDIEVGDIVTIDRGYDDLLLTHRVIEIQHMGGDDYAFTLQGDANPRPDPQPYIVSEVRKVHWHVPGAAIWIVWLTSPIIIALIVIAFAFLVGWAFWPRDDGDDPAPPSDTAPPAADPPLDEEPVTTG